MVRHGAASAQRGGVTGWGEGEISVVPAKAGTSQPCGGRYPSFLRRQEPRSPAVGGIRRSCGGRNLAALGLEDGAPIITPSQYPHTQPLHRALARLDSSLRLERRGAGNEGARFQLTGTTRAGNGGRGSCLRWNDGGRERRGRGSCLRWNDGGRERGARFLPPLERRGPGSTTGRCPHRGPATQCSLRRSNGPSTHASIS